MFERFAGRAERAGRQRARALTAALAERITAELPRGLEAEATEAGVLLSGKRLRARFTLEPALRWLLARMR
jgi:hypothetical protein